MYKILTLSVATALLKRVEKKGYLFPETVFNLSKKALTDVEIKVLQKGFDYAPIQNKVNKSELRSDFEEFCRSIRWRCYIT